MAYWGDNPAWQKLSPAQRAAAMALLEADNRGGKINVEDAKNALGAMINRADKSNEDLGDHVSRKIYQPTIEDAQFARLPKILQSPEFQELTSLANARLVGATPDWVEGATHFLAPEKTMLGLEAAEPNKYKSWRQWTGFDPATEQYSKVVMRDGSHAFLAPEGKHSAVFGNPEVGTGTQVADAGITTIPKTSFIPPGKEGSMDWLEMLGSLFSTGGGDATGQGLLGKLQSAFGGTAAPATTAGQPQGGLLAQGQDDKSLEKLMAQLQTKAPGQMAPGQARPTNVAELINMLKTGKLGA